MDNPYESPESPADIIVPPRSLAWTVVKVAGVSFFGLVVILFLLGPFSRGRGTREAVRRTQCKNNLKQIAVALHEYHDVYEAFPPAVVRDTDGKPLHSWRTLILPFIDQQALYNSIDLSKPWDAPINQKARETNVSEFRCPSVSSSLPDGSTTYLAVVGEHGALHPSLPRRFKEITDGTPKTLLVVELTPDRAIPWMQPSDMDVETLMSAVDDVRQNHLSGFQGVLCDGSVRFMSTTIDKATLRSLTTIDGNETIGEF
jgi:Protein of unknown function (DUF1559)